MTRGIWGKSAFITRLCTFYTLALAGRHRSLDAIGHWTPSDTPITASLLHEIVTLFVPIVDTIIAQIVDTIGADC